MANSRKKSHWRFLKYEKKRLKKAKMLQKKLLVVDLEDSCKDLVDRIDHSNRKEKDSIPLKAHTLIPQGVQVEDPMDHLGLVDIRVDSHSCFL